jgi:hypothetical protein
MITPCSHVQARLRTQLCPRDYANELLTRSVPVAGQAGASRPKLGIPAQGKGPGQHLRTGVRPVGNGLGLRCLLVARALSTPNPPSSRMSVPDPFGSIGLRLVSRAAGCERLLPWRSPQT